MEIYAKVSAFIPGLFAGIEAVDFANRECAFKTHRQAARVGGNPSIHVVGSFLSVVGGECECYVVAAETVVFSFYVVNAVIGYGEQFLTLARVNVQLFFVAAFPLFVWQSAHVVE